MDRIDLVMFPRGLSAFSMTTHETVNRRYGELQTLLREHFHADGRGLIEMVRSIETQLPATLVWELRSIGHIRNKVVHDGLEQVPRYFDPLCLEATASLKQLIAKNAPKPVKKSKPVEASKPSKPKKSAAKKTTTARATPARRKAAAKKSSARKA